MPETKFRGHLAISNFSIDEIQGQDTYTINLANYTTLSSHNHGMELVKLVF